VHMRQACCRAFRTVVIPYEAQEVHEEGSVTHGMRAGEHFLVTHGRARQLL